MTEAWKLASLCAGGLQTEGSGRRTHSDQPPPQGQEHAVRERNSHRQSHRYDESNRMTSPTVNNTAN